MNRQEFEQRVLDFITREQLPLSDVPVLVAVSGGADSVALLRVLLAIGVHCVVAHCNFHLRGEESNRDERFVTELCQRLGLELYRTDFDVNRYCEVHPHTSVEMACRELRYAWFGKLMAEHDYACVAVAHHRDDDVETLLLNLLRGTGLRGMTGMQPLNGRAVARPLLCVTRHDIECYLKELGEVYVTDSTNALNDYRRNQIRNRVLPAIEADFPDARKRIADTASHLRATQLLHDELVHDVAKKIVLQDDETLREIAIHPLMKYASPEQLLFELVRDRGFNHEQCVQAIDCVRNARIGAHFDSGDWSMAIERMVIQIYRSNHEAHEIAVDFGNPVASLPFVIELGSKPFDPDTMVDGKAIIALNQEVMQCRHVVVRGWRQGDRLRPYGMDGSKLVSDLFADAKWTSLMKRNARLLVVDDEVLWVMGLRASRAFTVPVGSTRYVLLKVK